MMSALSVTGRASPLSCSLCVRHSLPHTHTHTQNGPGKHAGIMNNGSGITKSQVLMNKRVSVLECVYVVVCVCVCLCVGLCVWVCMGTCICYMKSNGRL